MSEKNNVNPDHYKVAGRDRQGEDILQEVHKKQYAQAQTKENPKGSPRPKEDESKGDKSTENVK